MSRCALGVTIEGGVRRIQKGGFSGVGAPDDYNTAAFGFMLGSLKRMIFSTSELRLR